MLDGKLLTFLKVAQLKNYTRAAEELHMTQPAVTQHIKRLEEYYGCKLIDITGRTAILTEAGKILYHYANLQQVNETQLKNQLFASVPPLHIGATLSIADYYLDIVLISFLQENKERFSLTVGNTKQLLEYLLHGILDCAFIEGIFDTNLFEAENYYNASFCPVVSSDHPLCGKRCKLSELYNYPLILRESGSGTRAILENYLYLQNSSILSFCRVIEIGSFRMIKKLLSPLKGISFMYEEVAKEEVLKGELSYLEIEHYTITHPLYFVYLKNSIQKKRIQHFFSYKKNKKYF